MDRKRLATTLTAAYGFYGQELTAFAMRVWADALAGIDDDVIDEAFSRHLRDVDAGRWCPKPADILRQIRGDVGEQALIAWGEVIAAARSGGARFEGPAQEALESIGGMGRLRMAREDENGFLQRQFVAAFKAYATRDAAPPLLAAAAIKRFTAAR